MEKSLKDKVALITGASRGIGRATALKLAKMGANIMINYVRNEDAARETLAEVEKLGAKGAICLANVKESTEIDLLVDKTLEAFETIDIMVHSAAMGAFKPVHKLRANQWDISMEINAKAFLILTQKVLPTMEAKRSGKIIALSSLGAGRYIPNYGAVGISKSAVESLVRYLGAELAPKGVHVNCVSGGPIDTDALKFFPEYESLMEEAVSSTPAGRIGKPEDLANVIAFLVSPEAGWIYGQTIIADGGISLG